jgi:hypothetical protein
MNPSLIKSSEKEIFYHLVLCVATLQNWWPESSGNRGRDRMESVAGMKWNQWPGSNGMGGRNGVESLAGIIWNIHCNAPETDGLFSFLAS